MTESERKKELLDQLIGEAGERRDALTLDDDLRENRVVWIGSARIRLTRALGDSQSVWSFNNPDNTGSFAAYDDASDALVAAKAEYDRDIEYFRSLRRNLER
jgi:hypothetical protein